MPYFKWFTPSRRNIIALAIHLLIFGLSISFLVGAFYTSGNQHSGSYAVKFAFKTIATFVVQDFLVKLIVFIFVVEFMIFSVSRLHLRIAIMVMLFISVSSIVLGIFVGGVGFHPVQSLYLEKQSYHLSLYFNGSDAGYYELFTCDSFGIVCQRIHQYDSPFAGAGGQARLELDEASKKLSVIIDGSQVDMISIQ